MRTRLTVLGIIFASFLVTGAAQAADPSFDCAKASTNVEKLICGDDALAAQDAAMADAYRNGRRVLSGTRLDRLKRTQRSWARSRAEACPATADPKARQAATACLAGIYDTRTDAIFAMTARSMLRQPTASIEADRRSPLVCVTFDAKLDAKQPAALETYVSSKNGAKLAARINDNQLCVEGFPHGQEDQLTIYAGLRGSNAMLRKAQTVDLDVPDRPRRVAFPSSGLILPLTGSAGLPIETVNLDKVRVLVLRVDDRDVVANLRRGLIGQQVSYNEVGRAASKLGRNVWTGDLLIDSKQNQSARTALAIGDVMPDLKPGVYLAVAEDPETDFHDAYWATAQWFVVSDIGLTAFQGLDGLTVAVRSLSSALPQAGAKLVLKSNDGADLATVTSDAEGLGKFDIGYLRGQGNATPHSVLAYGEAGDFVYLDLNRSSLDLSDRGVDGRPAPGALDAYLRTERGVYRPGEPVHFTALLRSPNSTAVESQPLTLRVVRQDGLEVYRRSLRDMGAGGYSATISLPPTAATGKWRASLHASAKGEAIGATSFLVEDFVPPRIEATVEANRDGQSIMATVQADFLYGAPAADIPVEVAATVREARNPAPAFKGYKFGLAQESTVTGVRLGLGLGETDESGAAAIAVDLDDLPATTRPLEAEIKASVFDVGGRPIIARTTVSLKNLPQLIGVKPLFEDGGIQQGAVASFNIVALDASGTPEARTLEYAIIREEYEYIWFDAGGRWDYRVQYLDAGLVDAGTLTIATDTPALVSRRFDDWGRFRLDVTDPATGAATSVRFHAGWWGAGAGADPAPDKVKIVVGPGPHNPGDSVRVTIEPPFDAQVMVTVADSAVHSTEMAAIPASGGEITVKLPDAGAAGVYLLVNAFGQADGERTQAPRRAIGAQWIAFDPAPRTLDVAMQAPEATEPERQVNVTVQLGADAAGDPAYVTVAAVDDGVLGLTGYKSPDPEAYFLGKRRLGLALRDVYGQFIDAAGSVVGRVRSGGDAEADANANQLSNLPKKTQPVLAIFSGIVLTDPSGKAVIPLNLPDFTGRVRIMAQAWNQERVGAAESTMLVRRPVVATMAMPRFLSPNDTADISISIRNLSGLAGEYRAELTTSGVIGAPENAVLTANLKPGDPDARAAFEVLAIAPGDTEMMLTVTGPNGRVFERRRTITTRPAAATQTRKFLTKLKPGKSLTVDPSLLDGLYPETTNVVLGVNPLPDLDLPSILAGLSRYPYGCAEQTTSKAMPLLHVKALQSALRISHAGPPADAVDKGVLRLLGMQSSSGGFGFWNSQSEAGVWISAYVTDFLVDAKQAGYAVPQAALDRALTRLSGLADIRYRFDRSPEGTGAAYALYVKAKAGVADPARVRRFAAQLPSMKPTSLGRAFVAASLSAVGDRGRARALFATIPMTSKAQNDAHYYTYGSNVRNAAAILALMAASQDVDWPVLEARAEVLSAMVHERRWLSTQEQAWIVKAAAGLTGGDASNVAIGVDGVNVTLGGGQGLYRTVSATNIASAPRMVNNSDRQITGLVTVTGSPSQALPAAQQGFTIERTLFTADGSPLDPSKVRQNDIVVVTLKGQMIAKGRARALAVDYLPAGLELENAKLGGDDLGAYGWLGAVTMPEHVELRDDRYIAQVNLSQKGEFRVAYIARAVTPGHFAHGGAHIEDMYQPEQFGRGAATSIVISKR